MNPEAESRNCRKRTWELFLGVIIRAAEKHERNYIYSYHIPQGKTGLGVVQ